MIGDSDGLPPSLEGHVAIPVARNRVSRPFSSRLLMAQRLISRSFAAVIVASALGSNSERRIDSPESKSDKRPEWYPSRSRVPNFRFRKYRRLLRRDLSMSLLIQAWMAGSMSLKRSVGLFTQL